MLGNIRNIHFPFDTDLDTSIAVASEMVEELDLTDQDVSTIADMIDNEIQSCIPDWAPRDYFDDQDDDDSTPDEPQTSSSASPLTIKPNASPAYLALERLPSGRRYWCDSPKGFLSPLRPRPSNFNEENSQNEDNDCNVKTVVEKLECLLMDQQKELDELRRKHGSVVLDILKKLPPETRQEVANICNVEIDLDLDS